MASRLTNLENWNVNKFITNNMTAAHAMCNCGLFFTTRNDRPFGRSFLEGGFMKYNDY